MSIEIKRIDDDDDLKKALGIREKVFVEEQNVDPALEYDEFENNSTHYLALLDGKPAGTARWRYIGNKIKMERFAVLREFRNKGIGRALVKKLLDDTVSLPVKEIYLHAQVQVIPFYSLYGFDAEGPVFEEAEIMHRVMKLSQKPA